MRRLEQLLRLLKYGKLLVRRSSDKGFEQVNKEFYNALAASREAGKSISKEYKISYCTGLKNRLKDFSSTVLKNIEQNRKYPKIEFVILNYNSQDDLDLWVKKNLSSYIESGIVKYYKTPDPQYWHFSKVKNLSHHLATGEILVNLDGDNFLGEENAFFINEVFNLLGPDILLHFMYQIRDGSDGRLAITKENFIKLGGYDESLHAIAYDDIDFIDRAVEMGLKYWNIKERKYARTILNTKFETMKHIENADLGWDTIREENFKRSKSNIEKGNLKVNSEVSNCYTIFKNFSPESTEFKF